MKLLVLFVFLFSMQLMAEVHTGRISQIDFGEPNLLLISNGYVLKVSLSEKNRMEDYLKAYEEETLLNFQVDDQRFIKSVYPAELEPESSISSDALMSYEPSVLGTEEEVSKIFKNLRRGARSNSQCYNRAHIWAYESKKKSNLDSMKVFMFFTRKYIRAYNYHWWFHVSPFTYVASEERVLDFKFTKKPLTMKEWTDVFIYNHATCPTVNKYSDYEQNQYEEYCYLYKTSMFYFQPRDLDNLEREGTSKSDWVSWEVNLAYRNGFGLK